MRIASLASQYSVSEREAERQYREIEQRFFNPDGTEKAGAMLAPNGNRTKLDKRQWIQVRTQMFKNWFGDWETAGNINSVLGLSSINAVKSIEGDKRSIKDMFMSFGTVTNKRDGRAVVFPNQSVGKIRVQSGIKDIGKFVPSFKLAFENSIPAFSENPIDMEGHKPHYNVVRYHQYIGKIRSDETDYFIRFTVREESGSRNEVHASTISDVEIYKNESAGPAPHLVSNQRVDSRAFTDIKLANWLSSVNPDSVSKVVDENGEPLVVYHGTENGGFEIFRVSENGGAFFSSNKGVSDTYADPYADNPQIYGVFLNIRNPMNVDARGASWNGIRDTWSIFDSNEGGLANTDRRNLFFDKTDADEYIENTLEDKEHLRYSSSINDDGNGYSTRSAVTDAMNAGNDGLIVDNVWDSGLFTRSGVNLSGTDYVALSPNQIKSATGNNGDFSIRVGVSAEIGNVSGTVYNTKKFDKDGVRAIVAFTKNGNPIITGYEIDADDKAGAIRRSALSTNPHPHVSSEEAVAALKNRIAQYASEVNGQFGYTTKAQNSLWSNGVTPEQDKAYLDAEKNKDASAGQQLADNAAKSMGYKIGPVWHWGSFGSEGNFTPNGPMHFGTKSAAETRSIGKIVDDAMEAVTAYQDDSGNWQWDDGNGYTSEDAGEGGYNSEKQALSEGRVQAQRTAYDNIGNSDEGNGTYTKAYIRANNVKRVEDALSDRKKWDSLAKQAIAEGFDTLVYANKIEDVGKDSYVSLVPGQIKSAEPFTYDDSGAVIPLSQRFNETNGDIRYSIETAKDSSDRAREGFTDFEFFNRVAGFVSEWVKRGGLVADESEQKKIFDAAIGFYKEFSKKVISLSDGSGMYFAPHESAIARNGSRIDAWVEYAIHAVTNDIGMKRRFDKTKADSLSEIERIVSEEKCFPAKKNRVCFTGKLSDGHELEVVGEIDGSGNIDADLREITTKFIGKNKMPQTKTLSAAREAAWHQGLGSHITSTESSIPHSGGKVNGIQYSLDDSLSGLEPDTSGTGPAPVGISKGRIDLYRTNHGLETLLVKVPFTLREELNNAIDRFSNNGFDYGERLLQKYENAPNRVASKEDVADLTVSG